MEDDNGLDLSLSLPYGQPSASLKGKNGIGSEATAEEADRGSKLIEDFKNFLDGGIQREGCIVGSQKPEENLFYDLSKSTANVDISSNMNGRGFWGKNDSRSNEEVRWDTGSKRKNLFDEINHQKRHERETHIADLLDKTGTPYISITADESSTAENEGVADSEAEGSTSNLVQHHDAASEKHNGNLGLSKRKEVNGVSNSGGALLQGGKRFPTLSENDFKVGHVSYGVPFSGQSLNMLNMTYPLSMKESNSNHVSGMITSGYTSSGTVLAMAPASNDRPATQQPVIPAPLPLIFGFSPVQMSTIEPATVRVNALKPFEEGLSSHTGGGMAKSTGDQARGEGCPPEHPPITPGIAAEVQFGGSGSSPDLPWVSTTGPGPNGKTISGVTYKHSGTQVRIVCACHGSHMSVEEFVQHASEEPPNRSNGGSRLASFPNSNPAASAQS